MPVSALRGRMAPPHPRGSTLFSKWLCSHMPGSPAPAGIDPYLVRHVSSRRWLPRTRGDRPEWAMEHGKEGEAPPHPRGSTLAKPGFAAIFFGSPAPAGIDPALPVSPHPRTRLPRTRGDRPSRARSKSHCSTAPPHPRGSTPLLRVREQRYQGSPAPAGIDPAVPDCHTKNGRLPRTRGDRP